MSAVASASRNWPRPAAKIDLVGRGRRFLDGNGIGLGVLKISREERKRRRLGCRGGRILRVRQLGRDEQRRGGGQGEQGVVGHG
jgi:hypothetical protein